MPMIITIHQPDFLPWLGFFDRWKKSDLYIILDDVQFLRRGWHHRDRIKTSQGPMWLTVPVQKKGNYNQLIRDVKIDNTIPWRDKHLRTLEMHYGKAPNFHYCFKSLQEIYAHEHISLIDLNMDLLRFLGAAFTIGTPVVFSSDYATPTNSSQKLVDLVKRAGGSYYLTGLGAKEYLDEGLFEQEQIKVIWQKFQHPVYPQLHGDFVPMLSSIDYLMMQGTAN